MKLDDTGQRLSRRKLKLWSDDYLVYRYLWPNLENAIDVAFSEISKATPKVLDVGCGNKPYSDLFRGTWCVGLNYSTANATPDVVGDAMNLPFADESFDIVFSAQVLEHLPQPGRFLKEANRVLMPGGLIVLSCPFYWPLHEEPHDYYRFTKYGLNFLLKATGFESPTILADGGGWAQAFLSIGLQLPRYLRILRIFTNLAGAILDKYFGNENSTANYTLWARKLGKP